MADNLQPQQIVSADDSSNLKLPEDPATPCWLPVTPTLPSTLESRGLDSSSWAVHLQKLDHFEFDMDFPRLHAMLRWLHEELWDCTINFVLEHKLIEMADPLRYVAGSKEAYAAVYEVRQNRRARVDRLDFSHRPHSGSITGLLNSADEVRHAAAHHRSISVGDLFQAMLLPRVLKDTKRADRIEHTFYAISDEAGVFFDESTRMDAERIIYTLPCGTVRQKLVRLESLLQKLCFVYAQLKAPRLLSSRYWVVPERVEISKLSDWRFQILYQDDFLDEKFDSESFHETVIALQHLRNQLWHRYPVTDADFLNFFHTAVRFAIYTANRAGSINIEIEAEMMFTGKSRADVLARLHRVYQAEELPAEEDDRRRECRRRVAIGKVLEESGIEMSNRETVANWNYMFQYPQPEEPYLEEPSVEASGEALKDLGNANTWGMEDGVPAGEDLEETFPDDTYWEEGRPDSDYPETQYPEAQYPEAQYPEAQYPEAQYPEAQYPEAQSEAQYPEAQYPKTQYQETEDPETATRETQTQVSDQHYPKEAQRTVPNIDPTCTPPDSLPFRSQETFDTRSNTSPAPTTPEALTQHNPTTMTEAEVSLPTVHDSLDTGNGATPAFEKASTVACERARLLTFSPSMHECLKW